MTTRTETDSFGSLEIPVDALWGVQTARSLHFFAIGSQRMPLEIVHALALIKWAAAQVNLQLQRMDAAKAQAIADAALQIAEGRHDDAFPLSVWQTGSGTQTNMNVNEVIARIASARITVHPNDDVNRGQSSNDVFPTAMHMAALEQTHIRLLPALSALHQELLIKAVEFKDMVKIGRTHMQDATPVTLGQEFGGYAAQLALCEEAVRHALGAVGKLAIGGTAVGTGINTHAEFGPRVAALLAEKMQLPLTQADNLFAAMAGHEALVALHGSLRMLAIALNKMANDIRLMGSGPRAGLGELLLPQNEAGSSIMPGKVNPTQIEALTMVCAQVMGHDVAIGMAAAQGQFELNVYKPLIALNMLDSIRLLSDAMQSFRQHCLMGIRANAVQLERNLQSSLMLVTALAPHIGYDKAARIARHAQQQGTSLREAALALGHVTAQEFDAWVRPEDML
ncbi:class II fumarate hydratase [Rhodoferax sp. GW822-FHT02A01]|uniref:class II fumarate hydratase n=1 Tax=Rhodoferax sp. GW822-FHT02A01 TaxID=3141537 RepID=UPI00315D1687